MSRFNKWFLSLQPEEQAVLREDKWLLASRAYDAGVLLTKDDVKIDHDLHTKESLLKWATNIIEEDNQLGETLFHYANHWRSEVNILKTTLGIARQCFGLPFDSPDNGNDLKDKLIEIMYNMDKDHV